MGLSLAGFCVFLFCIVDSVLALLESLSRIPSSRQESGGQVVINILRQYLPETTRGTLSIWEMIQITALCGAVPGVWYLHRRLRRKESFTPSWKSTSKLNKRVVVNEEQLGGKSFKPFAPQFAAVDEP
jgi:sugar phosphate permease